MSNLDLTTFNEVDSAGDITVTAAKAAFDTIRNDAVSHLSLDLIQHDFNIEFEVKIDAVSGESSDLGLIGVSDTLGTLTDMAVAGDGIVFTAFANNNDLQFKLIDWSNVNTDSYTHGGTSTPILYCTFKRVGTTATVEIYSDAGRTTLLDTLSITCESDPKQYVYALIAVGGGSDPTDNFTGYVENFETFYEHLDLTEFTEVDSGGDVTVTPKYVHFSTVRNDERSFVYKDAGINNFTDFHIEFEAEINSASGDMGLVLFAAISNTIGTRDDMEIGDDGIVFGALANYGDLTFFLADYNENDQDNYYHGGTTSPLYYCTFARLGSIATVNIYSDPNRTNLVDALSITCDTGPKQYLYAFSSGDTALDPADTMDGYSQNFIHEFDFVSGADIVFDIDAPYVNHYVNLTSNPSITFNATGGRLWRSNEKRCFPDIVTSISSDGNAERHFASAPSIGTSATSSFLSEISFTAIAELIVFDFQRPKIFERKVLRSVPSIGFDISTRMSAEREFASEDGPTFGMISAVGNAERKFASRPFVMIWTWSHGGNAERQLAAQADIAFDFESVLQRKREFAVNIAVEFSTAESHMQRYINFIIPASIDFVTPSVNIFKINNFASLPGITFGITDADVFVERRFEIGAWSPQDKIHDINWNISDLVSIYTIRNLASTVNIIVNVKSLNIWNLEIESLFPVTVRSLTPKRTVNLI
jgi:hypothetical protein